MICPRPIDFTDLNELLIRIRFKAMAIECECPEDHTITKLGHCATCPYSSKTELPSELIAWRLKESQQSSCSALRDRHHDGTLHNFEWATYSDAQCSYGVCRCGLSQYDYDLMRLP